MGKRKLYVVFEGKKPGIYQTWDECKEQVEGIKGSKFKSYSTEEQANEEYEKYIGHNELSPEDIARSISSDASCSGVPGILEYRVVETINENVIFSSPTYPLGTNNIGEFLALVKAMQYLSERDECSRIIFVDSVTAISWVKKKKVKTNLEKTDKTEELYSEILNAEEWLGTINIEDFKLVKWETHIYGEIKADFGRKRK
ncbi:ribonuclease H1 domain-containing protein [Bacillus cereus]|uniref:ribonuclease H1 domain-containing protein n=1 Tax=Bacillus cereus TaxID=1396 RepID=UPI0015952AAC|nr:ribonuclease H family protein [Bacillus cereus]